MNASTVPTSDPAYQDVIHDHQKPKAETYTEVIRQMLIQGHSIPDIAAVGISRFGLQKKGARDRVYQIKNYEKRRQRLANPEMKPKGPGRGKYLRVKAAPVTAPVISSSPAFQQRQTRLCPCCGVDMFLVAAAVEQSPKLAAVESNQKS
jgi:hypothetical protein